MILYFNERVSVQSTEASAPLTRSARLAIVFWNILVLLYDMLNCVYPVRYTFWVIKPIDTDNEFSSCHAFAHISDKGTLSWQLRSVVEYYLSGSAQLDASLFLQWACSAKINPPAGALPRCTVHLPIICCRWGLLRYCTGKTVSLSSCFISW